MLSRPGRHLARIARTVLRPARTETRAAARRVLPVVALVLCVASVGFFCADPSSPSSNSARPGSSATGSANGPAEEADDGSFLSRLDEFVVVRVVDGDTIDVRPGAGGETQRVRLIGVDTPESKDPRRPVECFAEEAAAFTARLRGKLVRLEYDVERHDRYGRTLAYVYLSDGTFFNLLLIEEGYGLPYTVPPNLKYADLFLDAARRARENGKGLWQRC